MKRAAPPSRIPGFQRIFLPSRLTAAAASSSRSSLPATGSPSGNFYGKDGNDPETFAYNPVHDYPVVDDDRLHRLHSDAGHVWSPGSGTGQPAAAWNRPAGPWLHGSQEDGEVATARIFLRISVTLKAASATGLCFLHHLAEPRERQPQAGI